MFGFFRKKIKPVKKLSLEDQEYEAISKLIEEVLDSDMKCKYVTNKKLPYQGYVTDTLVWENEENIYVVAVQKTHRDYRFYVFNKKRSDYYRKDKDYPYEFTELGSIFHNKIKLSFNIRNRIDKLVRNFIKSIEDEENEHRDKRKEKHISDIKNMINKFRI